MLYVSADIGNNNGVVFSNQPLKDLELFEVRITDMIDKWIKSIKVGIIALQPDTMEIPATMRDIQRSNTWFMDGCYIMSGQECLKRNYGINLDSLKVCVCVYVCACVRA